MSAEHVIWKHGLATGRHEQHLALPVGAEIVHVAMQGNVPTLWFRCDPAVGMVLRRFRVVGTGAPFPAHLTHVGTCFDGPFVLHVLEDVRTSRPAPPPPADVGGIAMRGPG